VSNLIDRYLGQLYQQYEEHTRDVLIRQARDILVCTFHGDLVSFEEIFLSPAALIIAEIKQQFAEGAATVSTTYYISCPQCVLCLKSFRSHRVSECSAEKRDIVESRAAFELRLLIIN
jgi:hypothetical protein